MDTENIVKKTCKELQITQRELAEILGVAPNTTAQWATQTQPPEMAIKFMNLLLEYNQLKEKYNHFKTAFDLIDKARSQ